MTRILALSDFHNHPLPAIVGDLDADILMIAGDMTMAGSMKEMFVFAEGLAEVRDQFNHVIFVNGNHELEVSRDGNRQVIDEIAKRTNSIYLEDTLACVEGLRIFGSPYVPGLPQWAYHYPYGTTRWNKIPEDVDIVLTHGPAYGLLDHNNRWGCYDLAKRLRELPNLKLHIFGHIHEDGYKLTTVGKYKAYNVCICDEKYDAVNPPTEIEV